MNTDKHRYKKILFELFRRCCNKTSVSICVYLWLISFIAFTSTAQVRPVYDRGTTGLMQLLKRLNTTASVLMIGAHPDDEDTALLAYLARGENARTAYLSLTRGDGGQNIIGPELGEALGVIRTEELLQARRLDGAEQFFTRAYDYGFSKTLAEAKQKWDEKVILCDTVRVIRNFRPLVVISQFSGTPADGHGQHQFSGYISPLAVKAAADATQCAETGAPWEVKKFYVRHRGQGEPTLRINTGKYDPLLGRSYFEIAMEARSQHKSQEQGVLELKGDQFSNLNLVASDAAKEESLFTGLDTSWSGFEKYYVRENHAKLSFARKNLAAVQQAVQTAVQEYDPVHPNKIIQLLIDAKLAIGELLEILTPNHPPAGVHPLEHRQDGRTAVILFDKWLTFEKAIGIAAGIRIDALADREAVASGEKFGISVKSFLGGEADAKVRDAKLTVPEGWKIEKGEAPPGNTQGFFRRETGDHAAYFNVTVPKNEQLTRPYWLIDARQGDMFRWSREAVMSPFQPATKPFQSAVLRAEVTLEIFGTEISFEVPVEYRYADDIRGEIRRNINVVPPISVELDQTLLIVPYSDRPLVKTLAMSLTSHSTKPVSGDASLNIESDDKWKIEPATKPFELKKFGEKLSIEFKVTIPARTKQGSYKIAAIPNIGGSFAPATMYTITYPHIQTHRFYRRAVTDLNVLDMRIAPVKIGYIMGSGDRVAEAIRQMGFDVEVITESELANGDLSKYDTIVVGIRAYQVRPDVVANNKRLLDFANGGGTLVVQYQLPGYAQQNLMPYPAQMGPRVADENAAVTIVAPQHPILNFPNKITDADFAAWVQERNLYNFSTMDAKYTGLLESHDAGEAENKGGLVVADVGKGKYIYCSYSMFRQLPAGVPGAYRLFANVLSFPKRTK